ncbi:HU family DNA-binding protein [Cutibacterium acnes]
MNKPVLIETIAAKAGITKADAAKALDALTGYITEGTGAGHSIAIHGFGTFVPRYRAARTGRNPATGETIEIAASTTLGFKPSKGKAGA